MEVEDRFAKELVYATELLKAAKRRARREEIDAYAGYTTAGHIIDGYSAFDIDRARRERELERGGMVKAIGLYYDNDDKDYLRLSLTGEDWEPGPHGATPVEFLRRYSYLGRNVRILLKDMTQADVVREVVNSKKNPYHTKDFQFAGLAPEDMSGQINLIVMSVDWDRLDQGLKNQDFDELSLEMNLPDVSRIPEPEAESAISYLMEALKFNTFWSNACLQSVQRRGTELMYEHLGDVWEDPFSETSVSVKAMLEELNKIEDSV